MQRGEHMRQLSCRVDMCALLRVSIAGYLRETLSVLGERSLLVPARRAVLTRPYRDFPRHRRALGFG